MVSEKRKAAFVECFSFYDKGKQGKVETKFLGEMMRCLQLNPTNAEVDALISQHGSGGFVARDAFVEICDRKESNPDPKEAEKLMESFKVFDKEGQGFISVQELKYLLQTLGEKIPNEVLEALLKDADNGNGQVNYASFIKLMFEPIV